MQSSVRRICSFLCFLLRVFIAALAHFDRFFAAALLGSDLPINICDVLLCERPHRFVRIGKPRSKRVAFALIRLHESELAADDTGRLQYQRDATAELVVRREAPDDLLAQWFDEWLAVVGRQNA